MADELFSMPRPLFKKPENDDESNPIAKRLDMIATHIGS